MFQYLEQEINISKNKGFVFLKIIDNFLSEFLSDEEQSDTIGFDTLDILINRLLSTHAINEEKRKIEPETIFYQKTPARVILELSKKVNQEDVFYDIGSGIGHLVIL